MKKKLSYLYSLILAITLLLPTYVLPLAASAETAVSAVEAKKITISFAIEGKSENAKKDVSIPKGTVTVTEGKASTVIEEILKAKNIPFINQGGAYISSVGGLAAFDGGNNSGWLFSVNGKYPNVGIADFDMHANDELVLQYTDDYTKIDFGWGTEPTNPPVTKATVDEAISKVVHAILKKGSLGDWEAIAVLRSGLPVPKEVTTSYLAQKESYVKSAGRLNGTGLETTILGVLAAGGDPTNFGGKNLIEKLYNDDKGIFGINSVIFALVALDGKNYEVPANAVWTREKLLAKILSMQSEDGSWDYYDCPVDMTGMAMTALAPYQNMSNVQEALKKAKVYLQKVQKSTGGYGASGKENSKENTNSTAQAIMGLSLIGEDVTGDAYTKNGTNVMQNVLSYQLPDGRFKWLPTDEAGNGMATEQVAYTLVQYKYMLEGKGSIYNWTTALQTADLDALLQTAAKLDQNSYTKDSWAALQTAVATAKAVRENKNAKQEEIDAAVAMVKAAIAKLQPQVTVHKDALAEKLQAVAALQDTDYTKESWAALQTTVTKAKALMEQPNATQAEVDALVEEVTKGIAALVKVTPKVAETPKVAQKEEQKNTLPDTALFGTATWMMNLVGMISIIGAYMLWRRKSLS